MSFSLEELLAHEATLEDLEPPVPNPKPTPHRILISVDGAGLLATCVECPWTGSALTLKALSDMWSQHLREDKKKRREAVVR